MAYPVKQPVNINFQGGLNLKADPYQVPVGNFLSLVNSVFDKVGRLTKRNGFPSLTALPNSNTSYLTTFHDDLQAIGSNILAYSAGQSSWVNQGSVYPIELSTLPLIRNSLNQSQSDSVVSPNGLICTVYTEQDSSVNSYKYAVADSVTGQNIIEPTLIPGADVTYGTPRVFLIGTYFLILYTKHPGAYTLNYLAISYQNTSLSPVTAQLAASYQPATTVAFDAVALNNSLFVAYNGAAGSGIKMLSISSLLVLSTTFIVDAAHQGTIFSLAADVGNQVVWVTYSDGSNGYSLAESPAFIQLRPPTHVISTGTTLNLASTAQNNILTFYYELSNNYSYDGSIPTHFIDVNTVNIVGTVGSAQVSVRSLGLASKAFLIDGVSYYLGAYQSPYQPTYFLVDGSTSTSANPIIVAKLAYSNGGGYLTMGLPNVSLSDNVAQIPYLFKDLVQAVNKNTNVPSGSQVNGIYSQTGINLATFTLTTDGLVSTEIGNTLQLSGGFLWTYDGYLPVENNFFLWPDSIELTGSTTGGIMTAQQYFYQVVYQWTDNQGNAYTSAPSIPVSVTTTGSTSSVTVHIPTLRLTYKISSPIKICVYRWSTAQQIYYQVTNLTFTVANSLQLNSTTTDSINFVDTLPDSSILGNNILYTTGGVVEDVSAPSSNVFALFDDRFWMVDAEDRNLLWYSKQVIESTPVEMSDLFTLFVSPSTGAQGSTGDIKALWPMDDKLIIFKKDAIYYINGNGPDNTGANSTYSQPIFITSTVGCSLPKSIAVIPSGLMFQSDKGIWLLGRDLSTKYIGADVEDFNSQTVTSALAIPGTNQVRFALDSGITLMYDYYVNQWGEFAGIPSVSSTLYQSKHTIVNQYGQVAQESAGTYLDGANPVLMSFSTSWLNVAGLRGYIRAYWFYFLGTYLSPHKLDIKIAYDYNSSATQGDLIAPINYAGPYGSDPYYGGDGSTPYGGPGSLEQWQIFFQRQRCKSFQITMSEVFDPTFGTIAGPGLTLSGLNVIVGTKKSYSPIPQRQQVG